MRATALTLLLTIPAGRAPGGDIEALAATEPAVRAEAAARLRRDLVASDLDRLLAFLATSPPRAKAAVFDIFISRRDLGLRFMTAEEPAWRSLQREFCATALLYYYKNAGDVLLGTRDTVQFLSSGLGDSSLVQCTVNGLDLDDLVYEVRRARILPYFLLIAPGAPSPRIALPVAVANAESVALDSMLLQQIDLHACGTERTGDRSLPTWVVVGGEGGERGGDFVARCYETATTGTGAEARRAAENLMTLALDPVDAAVVSQLGRGGARADAMAEAICQVPGRGAALLLQQPASLDAFLQFALRKPGWFTKAARVVKALGDTDGSGRSIAELLLSKYKESSGAERLAALEFLARRGDAEASRTFAESMQSLDARVRTVALRGLRKTGDAVGRSAALETLSKSSDSAELREAAAILACAPGNLSACLPLLDTLRGVGRAVVAGLLLYSEDPAFIKAALAVVPSIGDPASLELLVELASSAARAGGRERIKRAFGSPPVEWSLPMGVVAAECGLVSGSEGTRLAEFLLKDRGDGGSVMATCAAGRVATTEFVRATLRSRVFVPANDATRRPTPGARNPALTVSQLRNLGFLLGSHLQARPRSERSTILDALIEPMPGGGGFSLDDLATMLNLTGRGDFVMAAGAVQSSVGIALDRATRFPVIDPD
jgi:hypothetical protein